jgi:hypothetical protein
VGIAKGWQGGQAGALARRLAERYGSLTTVEAVAVGGSRAAGDGRVSDGGSDLDLYVYARGEVPASFRASIAREGGQKVQLDNRFFEPGDEWVDQATGVHVDVMFRTPAWIKEQLDRVLVRHEASIGYSTCVWHNVREAIPLHDRAGFYAALAARARAPYPEPLRRAVVARNLPLLRRTLSSFLRQLERALVRGDAVAVNHRAAAFLASAFDALFAMNRVLHPGEKRLVAYAEASCALLPPDFRDLAVGVARGGSDVVAPADALARGLEELAAGEGLA